MDSFAQRKKNRLALSCYNVNGAYFVTICTKDRRNIFWSQERSDASACVGAALRRPPGCLNDSGKIVLREIDKITAIYQGVVTVDNYVVMPNHVHLLLSIHAEKLDGRRDAVPSISSVINQFKGCVCKGVGFPCWQKSFHDHIVRDERDHRLIWEYIDANPGKWEEDRYYISETNA